MDESTLCCTGYEEMCAVKGGCDDVCCVGRVSRCVLCWESVTMCAVLGEYDDVCCVGRV